MKARIQEVWKEVATGQQYVVIGVDPAGGQVQINGGWKPEDLAPDYEFVSKPVSTQDFNDLIARVATLETQLATTNAMAMASAAKLRTLGL